ncbi:serine/threonine-protein phosphatase 7 long form homolog [Quercus lobata]|uniref:serine/threonine-protein phosphatase 7 long form homolog n=1 Tax=Quercus lobata TaxID=97700 RepID=UPI00124565BC|nr:serine/threonine-protein phosphatase 7 long form homolog [Quercus lobata]
MIACVSDMQQVGNVDPGPTVGTQLTRQPVHRSTLLWETPAGQVVSSVLKCRRRSCKLPEHGLDPRIARYITEAGFEGLFKVPNLEVDHALITALVERWRLETPTFHLLHGEMGIPLQDIELLGHRPPDPIPHPHENTSILVGATLRFTWLDAQFSGPLAVDATDEVVQQHACYHILNRLGTILFMDKLADRVSVMPLQFLNPISNVKRYSWGSGVLAWLYRHLCKASESKAMQIGGAMMLVQLWAYSRFPLICPVMRSPLPPVEAGPFANRYVI